MSYENATVGWAGAHQIQRTSERRSPTQGHSLARAGKLIPLLFILNLLLPGCIGGAHTQQLVGRYHLNALDIDEEMAITYLDANDYMITIVNATVYSVGYDEYFIIAKQHPRTLSNGVNRKVTNYFIIPLEDKISDSAEKNLYGPLTKLEFDIKREELGIGKLAFNINFKHLK